MVSNVEYLYPILEINALLLFLVSKRGNENFDNLKKSTNNEVVNKL